VGTGIWQRFPTTGGTVSEFGNFCGLAPRQGRWAVRSGLRFVGSSAARVPWGSAGTSEQPRAVLNPTTGRGRMACRRGGRHAVDDYAVDAQVDA
jgi:hypothetical protein